MHYQNISGYEPVHHLSVPINCWIRYGVSSYVAPAHCPSLVNTAPSIFSFEKRRTVYAEGWGAGILNSNRRNVTDS